MTTHYETLGVSTGASKQEIKKAYRRLAMKCHPDRKPGDKAAEDRFKDINEAQAVLLDDEKRTNYDLHGPTGPSATGGSPFGFSFTNRGFEGSFKTSDGASMDIGDMLRDLLKRQYTQQQRPATQHFQAVLTLKEAYTGKMVQLVSGDSVRIPAGVRTGNRIVHDGAMITIVVHEHKKFKRAGDDLLVDLQLSAIDAMLGCTAELRHLDGVTNIITKIDAGTPHGGLIRLKKKGMPNPESGGFGDLLIRCNIFIPTLTTKQKDSIMHLQPKTTLHI